jgi:hypothetical protein
MAAFPLPLVRRLGPADAEAVRAWWDGLSDADRRDLLARWDRRANRCDHARDEADGAWHRLPVRVGVRFLPAGPGDDWRADYLEHLLSNPELVVLDIPWRTFHIGCTTHPAARAALAAGVIPADFACPLGRADCPMRRLLAAAPGRDARLTLIRPRPGLRHSAGRPSAVQ